MTLLAPIRSWVCLCGAAVTTARCKAADHAEGLRWAQHVMEFQARDATLPAAPERVEYPGGVRQICAGCGDRAWIPPKGIHCVECLARGSRPDNWARPWTPAQDWILKGEYGLMLPRGIAEQIYRKTGAMRTIVAIRVRAGALGLDHRTNHGGWTVAQAVKMAGVTVHMVRDAIERGEIKANGTGKCRVLDDDAIDRLRSICPSAAFARTMSGPEMMRRLGYGETHASRLLRSGAIRAVKRGGRWAVDADHVEQIEREMRETGAIRRSLMDVPGLDEERARAREFARTIRRDRRREARRTTWMTQRAARRVLGLGRDEMRLLLEAGVVRGRRENDLWLAERADVMALVGDRRELLRRIERALALRDLWGRVGE